MIMTSIAGDRIQSELGAAEVIQLEPGAMRVFAADSGEQAVVVLDGAARAVADEGGQDLVRGAVVLVGAGQPVAVHAIDRVVTLFWLQAAVSAPVGTGTATRIIGPADIEDVAVHDPDRGFFRMTARLMVNGSSDGHRAFTIGVSTFAPGEGCHDLHRHAHAEELFLVWAGEGTHLSADRAAHRLQAGDLTWVGKSEYHGFRNTGPGVARAVFCYLGVDDRASAGYEVAPGHIDP